MKMRGLFSVALVALIHLERVRLDCDREASHNLNRLLDKPGLDASFCYGNIFLTFTVFRGRIYFIHPRSNLHHRHCSNDPI